MKNKGFLLAVLPIAFFTSSTFSLAQMPSQTGGPEQMAMIMYPVEMGADGKQYITTKAGYKINVPGLGIAPNASAIAVYKDPGNNYWYIDKSGNPTPVSGEQMQSVMNQMQAQAMQRGRVQAGQYPQGMPGQQGMPNPNMYGQNPYAQNVAPGAYPQTGTPQQSVVINEQPPSNSNASNSSSGNSSSGSSAMGTGLAAAGGAAVGALMSNAIYNNNNEPYYGGYGGVPYGAPVYRGAAAGQYYYKHPNGNNVYIAPNSTNAAAFNQYDKQGTWDNRQQWSQQASTARSNVQSQAQQTGARGEQFSSNRAQAGAANLGQADRNFDRGRQRDGNAGGGRRGGRRFR